MSDCREGKLLYKMIQSCAVRREPHPKAKLVTKKSAGARLSLALHLSGHSVQSVMWRRREKDSVSNMDVCGKVRQPQGDPEWVAEVGR